MDRRKTETIVRYFFDIPEMMRLLLVEQRELEEQYNALGAANMDGMPGGSEPGKPVEGMALALGERGVWDRQQEIGAKLQALTSDAAKIRGCLDDVNSKYKELLTLRYDRQYSWGKISMHLETPESTVRHWIGFALKRLGENLATVPTIADILDRASRARV